METNVNYTIVGAFVISLTAAIILIIIWLSSGLSGEDYTTYKVYMKEAVSGLTVEAPVEYNGVNVGSVTSIKINRKNPRLVELLLKIKSDTPVTFGTRAKLDVRSLSGVAYIGLDDKGSDMRPLIALHGQTYPVINTTPSILVRLDTALTQLNESFHQISSSINSLLDTQNLNSIKQMLVNLQRFTGVLANNGPSMANILQNTAKASQRFPALMQSGEKTIQSIQTQTLPAANQAVSNLDTMSNNLVDVSAELKENPSVIIRGKEQPELGPGER